MQQNQFKFKPFDKVLVRDKYDESWTINFYSHFDTDNSLYYPHVCFDDRYSQCIPYNEETAHLLNTRNDYIPKQTEIKYEVIFGFGKNKQIERYSEEQFLNFIKTAVCHNKDVKDFTVTMIIPD